MNALGVRVLPIAILGFVLLLTPPENYATALVDLDRITAGSTVYCSEPGTTPGSPCDDCISDGNGRFIKCFNNPNTGTCPTDCYHGSPTPTCVTGTGMCGGNAQKYTDSQCTSTWGGTLTCLRQYGTSVGGPPGHGVSCEGYCE